MVGRARQSSSSPCSIFRVIYRYSCEWCQPRCKSDRRLRGRDVMLGWVMTSLERAPRPRSLWSGNGRSRVSYRYVNVSGGWKSLAHKAEKMSPENTSLRIFRQANQLFLCPKGLFLSIWLSKHPFGWTFKLKDTTSSYPVPGGRKWYII